MKFFLFTFIILLVNNALFSLVLANATNSTAQKLQKYEANKQKKNACESPLIKECREAGNTLRICVLDYNSLCGKAIATEASKIKWSKENQEKVATALSSESLCFRASLKECGESRWRNAKCVPEFRKKHKKYCSNKQRLSELFDWNASKVNQKVLSSAFTCRTLLWNECRSSPKFFFDCVKDYVAKNQKTCFGLYQVLVDTEKKQQTTKKPGKTTTKKVEKTTTTKKAGKTTTKIVENKTTTKKAGKKG